MPGQIVCARINLHLGKGARGTRTSNAVNKSVSVHMELERNNTLNLKFKTNIIQGSFSLKYHHVVQEADLTWSVCKRRVST